MKLVTLTSGNKTRNMSSLSSTPRLEPRSRHSFGPVTNIQFTYISPETVVVGEDEITKSGTGLNVIHEAKIWNRIRYCYPLFRSAKMDEHTATIVLKKGQSLSDVVQSARAQFVVKHAYGRLAMNLVRNSNLRCEQ